MAKKNKVQVDVEVDDNGSLKQTAKKAKAAGAAMDDLGRGSGTADRNMKGAAQASSNGTKNFSKMAQGIQGGLVPAYATLAANVFAITAAFQFLKNAGDLAILEESQKQYAYNTGRSMTLLTTQLQGAARGMLSYADAASGAAIGAAAGLSNAQLEGLASAAYKASTALGRDLTDSFNRLTRGAIKAEPELLDELGIIIRLDTVTKDYARTLDVTANSLTAFQRTQAVTNAILAQSETKFKDLGENVNQVARLGKKFQDMLKDIQQFIQPVTNFIGKALADNITALAGAFSFLGIGIVRSLAPAAPAFSNISQKADDAVKSISAAANTTSKTGQRLASAQSMKDLSDKDLNYIEASTRAKSSTIINYDTKNKNAIIRNISIIRAQRKLADAQLYTGIKRMGALWKAELALMQAEHGKFLGTVKAGQLALTKGLGRLLGAAGFIGLLFTAVGIVKEIINYFKDPALKKFEENTTTTLEAFDQQKEATEDILKNLKLASTEAGRVSQQAELLSNINFTNLKDFGGLSFDTAQSTDDIKEASGALSDLVGGTLDNLNLQISVAGASGADVSGLQKLRDDLVAQQNTLKSIQSRRNYQMVNVDHDVKTTDEYNNALTKTVLTVQALEEANYNAIKPILDQRAALKGLSQAGESFSKLQDKIKQAPSNYRSLLDQFTQVQQALETGAGDNITLISDLTPAQQQSLRTVLGSLEDIKTVEEGITALKTKQLNILKVEALMERRRVLMQRKYMIALHGATPLQAETIQNLKKQEEAQQQIDEILAKHKVHNIANLDLGDATQKADAQKILNLQAQTDILQEQLSYMYQLEQAASKAFEKSLQTNIADLIKGDESSFRDAVKNIAKATLDGMADALAKSITQDLMSTIIDSPETKIKNAMMAAADYHAFKILDAMKKGSITPGETTEGVFNPTATTVKTATGTHTTYDLPELKPKSVIGDSDAQIEAHNNIIDSMESLTAENKSIFGPGNTFTSGLSGLFNGVLGGFTSAFKSIFAEGGILDGIGSILSGAAFAGAAGARYGGVLEGYATGGIAKGSQKGFPAILHGTEAVVPLPNGKQIPVEMRNNSAGTNNISVNVNIANDGRATTSTDGMDGQNLGKVIAQAVQEELQNQKRSGGILNPYGAS